MPLMTPEAQAIIDQMKADVLAEITPSVRADMIAQYAEAAGGVHAELAPVVEARAIAAADVLAKQMADSQVNAMAAKIVQGVELGLPSTEIAIGLLNAVELSAQQAKIVDLLANELAKAECPPLVASMVVDAAQALGVEARLEAIAGDEDWRLAHAERNAGALERGATVKRWITMGDDVVCDECDGNEAEGDIPIDEPFSTGDEYPPAHIGCRCEVEYGTGEE